MASDIKLLDGDEVLVESAHLTVSRVQAAGEDPYDAAINLLNSTGFWHISGPRTYDAGNPLSIFWHNNTDYSDPYLTINTAGGVGIGTSTPGYRLDVADRMRVRQAKDTAGIWFYQTKPAKDQAFVGMSTDTQVGVWGNTGAGWGLVMDTTTGNVGIGTGQTTPVRRLQVEGSDIHSGGTGAGFSFGDRKFNTFVETPTKGERWVWYSDKGIAHLWSGKDKLSVSSNGQVSINGSLQVLVPRKATVKTPGTTTGSPAPGGTAKPVNNIGSIASGAIGPIDSSKIPPISSIDSSKIPFITPFPAISVDDETGHVGVGVLSPSSEHQLDVRGDTQIIGNLTATIVTNTSSRTLKENIAKLSSREAVLTLTNLNPVKFNFKSDDAKELHVGFIAEDVPELVAMADRKTLSSMDIVAVLTKVVQEQHQQISQLVTEVNALKQAQVTT